MCVYACHLCLSFKFSFNTYAISRKYFAAGGGRSTLFYYIALSIKLARDTFILHLTLSSLWERARGVVLFYLLTIPLLSSDTCAQLRLLCVNTHCALSLIPLRLRRVRHYGAIIPFPKNFSSDTMRLLILLVRSILN